MSPARWCSALAILVVATCTYTRAEVLAQGGNRVFREISDDLESAVALISNPTIKDSILVAERSGLVNAVDTRSGRTHKVIDIEALVGSASPRGLMSVAARGSGSALILVVGYMDPQGDLVVGSFIITDPRKTLDEDSMTVIIKIARLSPHKLGSSIAFGSAGDLYIATSAGEANNDGTFTPDTNPAQLPQSLLGKVIRIKPGESAGYSVPADNPFAKESAFQPEIYALGFRAPYSISFASQRNQILVLDTNEHNNEINLVEPGRNYGWDLLDGVECRRKDRQKECVSSSYAPPILALSKTNSDSTLIGGFLYQGERYPELNQSLVFADSSSANIYAANENSSGIWEHRTIAKMPHGSITAIGRGSDGAIYAASDKGTLLLLQ